MKFKTILTIGLAFAMASCSSPNGNADQENDTDSTASDSGNVIEGRVFFKNINEGDTLPTKFLLEMGVEGMQVEPKGDVHEGFGHHHLLINDGFAEKGYVIVADSTHIHYGGGQESDSVSLAPGNYQLTLQFADGQHVSYGEAWSKSIHVTVAE